MKISNAKKISFYENFKEYYKQDRIILTQNYNQYLNKITKDNLLNDEIHNKQDLSVYFNPLLKNIKNIQYAQDNQLKLFSIGNEYVISKNNIKENDYYEAIYSKLLDEGINKHQYFIYRKYSRSVFTIRNKYWY